MTKLYKAVDRLDNKMSVFMVNEKGVAVSSHGCVDDDEIELNKMIESYAAYDPVERFNARAIDPVLIAEW